MTPDHTFWSRLKHPLRSATHGATADQCGWTDVNEIDGLCAYPRSAHPGECEPPMWPGPTPNKPPAEQPACRHCKATSEKLVSLHCEGAGSTIFACPQLGTCHVAVYCRACDRQWTTVCDVPDHKLTAE